MLDKPEHADKQHLKNTALQLNYNSQSAELVNLRCEFIVQRTLWEKKQHKLHLANQQLSLALQQANLNNQVDPLTQTLNRSAMHERIGYALSGAKRHNSQLALLFIDLNNFKPVNDQYGHEAGDSVLQQVGGRLKAAVRDSDAVSRHGGDEFLLLLTDVTNAEDISAFTDKLQCLLAEPYPLTDTNVWLSASIGIAVFPRDATTAIGLIGYADAAMYCAKPHSSIRPG
ncbi:GGDEF domain-containing protein [Arsukibacterium sp.]|uniref:GGDEF domain-containing protein n=1 Tax=Arsukibacterium sp. TaxID=1977258 RepID=UPI00299D2CFB|nr:GGDEF domain-containing protein [Arsukibacterium sp.]MDX1678424.1 GGDEF domain-containing protein [Arsukibacterium sp.]